MPDALNDLEYNKFVTSTEDATKKGMVVLNPDGSNIAGGTGSGEAAYSDSSDVSKKGLVDADRHVQVDVLTMPGVTVDTTGLATSAKQDTGNTSLSTLAGAVAGTEVQVDIVSGTVTANLSATDNAVLDDIASDTEAIKTSLAGTLTVTGGGGGVEYTEGDTDATITGSVAMMEVGSDTLQPIQGTVAGGLLVNLGANNDVTVTGTVDLGATDNAVLDVIAAKDFATQTTLAAINTKLVTGTDIGDVTINNSTGASAVNIQDGGNVITVDGTVAVTNAGITTIAGAVSGTEMQVDIVSSALPTGASTSAKQDTIIGHVDGIETILGTIDADTSNISTKIDTIAGAVKAEDAVHSSGDAGIMALGVANPAGTILAAIGDYTPIAVSRTGNVLTEFPYANSALADARTNSPSQALNTDAGTMSNVSYNYMHNGTTWDRLKGNATDGLTVNLGSNNDVTVTGTVDLGATDNAVLDTIDAVLDTIKTDTASIVTSVGTLDNAISGSEMQVDVVGALPAGTNAIGKLLAPDIDVTAHTNYARKYYTNAGAVTDGIIWSPAAGKRWHVLTMYIQVSAAATVTLEDDKAGGDDPVWKGELAANSGVVLQFGEKYPMASGEDAADLLITTTAGNVYTTCVGYEV